MTSSALLLTLVTLLVVETHCYWGQQQRAIPEGALGTIDWRYPNPMVDPLVPCPAEGTYPHPFNCAWYYRCHRYSPKINYYYRDYFFCEPGTVFSDFLDQCIWPRYTGEDRCEPSPIVTGRPTTTPTTTPVTPCFTKHQNCSPVQICPKDASGQTAEQTIEICRESSEVCGSAINPICSPGQIFDKTNMKCISEDLVKLFECQPETQFEIPQCYDILSDCRDTDVCQGTSTERYRLCGSSNVCFYKDGRNVSNSRCNPGFQYDDFSKSCIFLPSQANLCQLSPIVGQPCSLEIYDCRLMKKCDSSEWTLMCEGVEYCGRERTRMPVCIGPDQGYARSYSKCLAVEKTFTTFGGVQYQQECVRTEQSQVEPIRPTPAPHVTCRVLGQVADFSSLSPDRQAALNCGSDDDSTTKCDVTNVPYKNSLLCDRFYRCSSTSDFELAECDQGQLFDYQSKQCVTPRSCETRITQDGYSIPCNFVSEVPNVPQAGYADLQCKDVNLCSASGIFQGEKYLCSHFFRCTFVRGVLEAVIESCPAGQKFYLDTLTCSNLPTNLC